MQFYAGYGRCAWTQCGIRHMYVVECNIRGTSTTMLQWWVLSEARWESKHSISLWHYCIEHHHWLLDMLQCFPQAHGLKDAIGCADAHAEQGILNSLWPSSAWVADMTLANPCCDTRIDLLKPVFGSLKPEQAMAHPINLRASTKWLLQVTTNIESFQAWLIEIASSNRFINLVAPIKGCFGTIFNTFCAYREHATVT